MVAPSVRKLMAQSAIKDHKISVRKACDLMNISTSHWHYKPKLVPENAKVALELTGLSQKHPSWGFGLMYLHLRNVQTKHWNHKRVYGVYCDLKLNLKIKPKQRLVREKPEKLGVPKAPNMVWSMDFMHDQLTDARSFRSLNIIDDFNREALGTSIDLSLPSERVIRELDRIIEWRGSPLSIRVDNGPEYISDALKKWAESRGIALWFIQPGNPQQNAYVERFNRTMRQELFNQHLFTSIEQAQEAATQWQWTYNNERPHMALGGRTPAQCLKSFKDKTNPKPKSTLH